MTTLFDIVEWPAHFNWALVFVSAFLLPPYSLLPTPYSFFLLPPYSLLLTPYSRMLVAETKTKAFNCITSHVGKTDMKDNT